MGNWSGHVQGLCRLFDFLLKNIDKPLNRSEIIKAVWGKEDFACYRTVDVYINRLRRKLKYLDNFTIELVRGYGYIMKKRHGSE